MSLDERVPWSDELIERWKHEWDWDALSYNRDLPWSENLIDRYIDKWEFDTFVNDTNCESYHCTCGLSSNPALPWSLKFLKKYEAKWDWVSLTTSENIPWTLEIWRNLSINGTGNTLFGMKLCGKSVLSLLDEEDLELFDNN